MWASQTMVTDELTPVGGTGWLEQEIFKSSSDSALFHEIDDIILPERQTQQQRHFQQRTDPPLHLKGFSCPVKGSRDDLVPSLAPLSLSSQPSRPGWTKAPLQVPSELSRSELQRGPRSAPSSQLPDQRMWKSQGHSNYGAAPAPASHAGEKRPCAFDSIGPPTTVRWTSQTRCGASAMSSAEGLPSTPAELALAGARMAAAATPVAAGAPLTAVGIGASAVVQRGGVVGVKAVGATADMAAAGGMTLSAAAAAKSGVSTDGESSSVRRSGRAGSNQIKRFEAGPASYKQRGDSWAQPSAPSAPARPRTPSRTASLATNESPPPSPRASSLACSLACSLAPSPARSPSLAASPLLHSPRASGAETGEGVEALSLADLEAFERSDGQGEEGGEEREGWARRGETERVAEETRGVAPRPAFGQGDIDDAVEAAFLERRAADAMSTHPSANMSSDDWQTMFGPPVTACDDRSSTAVKRAVSATCTAQMGRDSTNGERPHARQPTAGTLDGRPVLPSLEAARTGGGFQVGGAIAVCTRLALEAAFGGGGWR